MAAFDDDLHTRLHVVEIRHIPAASTGFESHRCALGTGVAIRINHTDTNHDRGLAISHGIIAWQFHP